MSFNAGVAWMLLLDPTSPNSAVGRQLKEEEELRKKRIAEQQKKDEK